MIIYYSYGHSYIILYTLICPVVKQTTRVALKAGCCHGQLQSEEMGPDPGALNSQRAL